jgi:hypothetical protein
LAPERGLREAGTGLPEDSLSIRPLEIDCMILAEAEANENWVVGEITRRKQNDEAAADR